MSHIKLRNLNGYRENIKNKYKTLTAVDRFYIIFSVVFFKLSSFLGSVFTVSPTILGIYD